MKYYLEEHTSSNVVFSKWFWKHGLPTTTEHKLIPNNVPIINMTRDPIDFNLSIYKFWKKRRPELVNGESISEFIRKPLIVYDNTGGNIRPKYYFSSPTDYWNRYYYTWLNWEEVSNKVKFVKLEDLQDKYVDTVRSTVEFCDAELKGNEVRAPSFYLSASSDKGKVKEANNNLKSDRDEKIELSTSDIDYIRSQINVDVSNSLGYSQ